MCLHVVEDRCSKCSSAVRCLITATYAAHLIDTQQNSLPSHTQAMEIPHKTVNSIRILRKLAFDPYIKYFGTFQRIFRVRYRHSNLNTTENNSDSCLTNSETSKRFPKYSHRTQRVYYMQTQIFIVCFSGVVYKFWKVF